MNNDTKNPRPHAALIKAWADGAEIQRFDGANWRNEKHPSWDTDEEYRVKPDGAPWHPEYKDKYFIVDENFEPSEEVWDDCDFDDEQYERGNCFRTLEEAEAAAERVKAALKGEEPKSEKDLAQLNLSEGEAALIQALRNGEIIEVFYGDVCQLIMEVSMPDAVYDALEKIQAEQKENNNE